jgi:drug/metabolite transporter (DMT)-like permease
MIKKLIPYIAIICAMLIWAGAGIAVKEALLVFNPLTLIVLRFSIAVVLMLCVGLIFRGNDIVGLQRVEKKDLPLFLFGGLLQPFLYFIFETYTYQSFASPTIAEAMLSTQPIMAPIFAWVILREQVTRYNILGIIVSTVGMLLLLLVGSDNFAIGNPWGIFLAILTVSCSVGYSVVLRRIPSQYSPLTIVFYVQSISLVLFYILWGGDLLLNTTQYSSTLLNATQHSSTLLTSLLSVLYLAVLASVTAFILFCYTVRYIGVTRANIFNNIRPVFTALIMWMFFSEQLPLWKWIGIIIIIIGLFISQKHRKV